eukprot:CAMPEP_0114256948 /NCGR_PEP_ID=MMETSP0058-20121206/18454_1 /TAXON_ID=36894 /ORGANISM="Pyramimonas parkeae, CCMP726" /LENGTH=66 /DNA_ID=CAMNT_0001371607 /DNA_START=601 /DNA_END=798 /DNA_ORIENTATION=+
MIASRCKPTNANIEYPTNESSPMDAVPNEGPVCAISHDDDGEGDNMTEHMDSRTRCTDGVIVDGTR